MLTTTPSGNPAPRPALRWSSTPNDRKSYDGRDVANHRQTDAHCGPLHLLASGYGDGDFSATVCGWLDHPDAIRVSGHASLLDAQLAAENLARGVLHELLASLTFPLADVTHDGPAPLEVVAVPVEVVAANRADDAAQLEATAETLTEYFDEHAIDELVSRDDLLKAIGAAS